MQKQNITPVVTYNKQISKSFENIISQIESSSPKSPNLLSNNSYHHIFHELIINNISFPQNINLILTTLKNEINSKTNSTLIKKELMQLLPQFFIPFSNNISITFQYISFILMILENNVNSFIQTFLSDLFKSITSHIFKTECKLTETQMTKNYEIFQGFCIHNMKKNKESKQLFGMNCLCVLIENLDYFVLYDKYMKYLWEKLIMFLENENFAYKKHLLFCLRYLIMKCGGERFKTYANVTLYKVLDFLNGSYSDIKYETLLVIELIVYNCKGEIKSLIKQLVDCLEIVKKEKDGKIQEVVQKILDGINDKKYIGEGDDDDVNNEENDDINNNEMKISSESCLQNKECVDRNNSNKMCNKKSYQKPRMNSIFNSMKNEKFFEQAKEDPQLFLVNEGIINEEQYINNNNHIKDIEQNNKLHKEDELHNYEIAPTLARDDSNDEQIGIINKNINLLIKQMKDLSDKQITLIDSLDKIQKEFHTTTNELTNRINKLESIIANKLYTNNFKEQNTSSSQEHNYQIIQLFKESSLNDLKQLNKEQLENIIDSILEETNNFDISEIIALLKKVVSIKEYLKQEQINAIKNYLESISFNNNNTQVNEELQIEIKLLLHYFD
jgi:NADH:ubiquinone oxidoreductase subunit E